MNRNTINLAITFIILLFMLISLMRGGFDGMGQELRTMAGDAIGDMGIETPKGLPEVELDDSVSQIDRNRAKKQLTTLRVEPASSMASYDRELFDHWSDPDGNGCDARKDALLRWGQGVKRGASCKIEGGTWVDPYSGKTYTNPRQLDVDHVVALGEAWRSGADEWSEAKREKYANDPLILIPTYLSLNRQKGDKSVTAWLPPAKTYRDDYAVRWIAAKDKYGLTVTASERKRLFQLLSTAG